MKIQINKNQIATRIARIEDRIEWTSEELFSIPCEPANINDRTRLENIISGLESELGMLQSILCGIERDEREHRVIAFRNAALA
jgi:hypothetical protein